MEWHMYVVPVQLNLPPRDTEFWGSTNLGSRMCVYTR